MCKFYEGAFVAGQYQGKGKLDLCGSAVPCEGDFVAGEPHGSVTRRYADGRAYVGQFSGKRHGTARLRAPGPRRRRRVEGRVAGGCRITDGESVYDGDAATTCSTARFAARRRDGVRRHVQGGSHGRPGALTVGNVTMRGDFRFGTLVHGTITADDGRTYEIDVEKDEVLEVLKDGTKRPIDQLPDDITISAGLTAASASRTPTSALSRAR